MAETDQENIDALLEEMGENAPEAPPANAENQESSAEGDSAASAETDDMDALLAEIQTDPSLDQNEAEVNINDLLNEIQSGAAPNDGTATQSDIDALMETVGGGVGEMPTEMEEEGVNIDFLLDMKLIITFEVGRSKLLIGDLLSLGQGSVLELHRLVGEDLDMFVNGRLIAKGEVVVVNEKFGVRILDIVSPEDRIKNMAGFDKLT